MQALFKARGPSRERFNHQFIENAMGVERSEVRKFFGDDEATSDEKDRDPRFVSNEQQYDYMLRSDRVSELSENFAQKFTEELEGDERLADGRELETGVAVWLRDQMFKASTYVFMGKRVLEVYPELTKDFWEFDRAMLPLLFGLPKFVIPQDYKLRDKAVASMQRWQEVAWAECKGQPVDPDTVSWEPIYGSRINRARQRFLMYRGVTTKTKAASDLGMIFGLSSNAIPASCWILMHILDPNGDQTLLPRVLAELETARGDGGIDVSTLLSLPLLQSVFQEILRLYADVLVTRDIHSALVLPVDEGKRQIRVQNGDMVMAPSWLGHHDEGRWHNPSHDVFYAERFLKHDPDTGDDTFTLTGVAGKFFPFGGGKTMCPGRVFAKHEVFVAVAMVLLNYDIQPLHFLDGQGKKTDKFPELAKRFAGNGIVATEGDLKVRMKRRPS